MRCSQRKAEVVRAEGRVAASLDQSCVITGDPVAAHVDEPFEIAVPARTASEPVGGRDRARSRPIATSCSTTAARSISVSAIADTLALGLDPYPRSAGAEAALKEAGVLTEGEASPFAVLAQLRKTGATSS